MYDELSYSREWQRLWPVGSKMLWVGLHGPPIEVETISPVRQARDEDGAVEDVVTVRDSSGKTTVVPDIRELIPMYRVD